MTLATPPGYPGFDPAAHMPAPQRLLHVVADRMRWLQALDQARRRAQEQATGDPSATREAV